MRWWASLDTVQQGQRGALMPWAAVCLGIGVALYFALPREPGPLAFGAAGMVAVLATVVAWRRAETLGPVAMAVALICTGILLSGWRTHQVAGPVIDFRYYGPIEGRVVAIDRSASDVPRLTLDRVRLDRMAPDATPDRVRVSLHGDQLWLHPMPGDLVMMTGHLSGPSGPAEPGGFDFQRHSWFLGIGAVGYTRTPALLLEARSSGVALTHLRLTLADAIRARIPGQPGAFAAAVLTGDRSGLEAGPVAAMRASNIAHLLAISGLHMGLLTGFVYTALRGCLALIPFIALRYPIRKWAAVGALAAGAFYLALSGGNVATERAFIQVAVMFAAVLLDRRAVTLRSVAFAALIVMVHRPETLLGPGFQMSFAATAALVAGFNALRDVEWLRTMPKWSKGVVALVASSVIAGAATAPYSAAHFNQVAVYGLLANLLSVPVMGSVIIPAAVIAAILWPVGLDWVALWVMEQGLIWILFVAEWVAAMPGATRPIVAPPGIVLGLISIGGLVVILWQGRARWLGLAPMAVACVIWAGADRPVLLLADGGRLAGVLTPDGRALNRDTGDGFVAGIWLENDGDGGDQAGAAGRAGWTPAGQGMAVELAGTMIWQGAGRRALAEAVAACASHDLIILSEPVAADVASLLPAAMAMAAQLTTPLTTPRAAMAAAATPMPSQTCQVISAETLAVTGALAFRIEDGQLRIVTAAERQGSRPWSPYTQ